MISSVGQPSHTKILNHVSILDYFDRPLILQLADSIGGSYLGLVRESEDSYAVIGTPPILIQKFRCGIIDLKTVILKSEMDPWYVAHYETDQDTLTAKLQDTKFLDVEPLPEDGSYLQHEIEEEPSVDQDTLKQAQDRTTTIIKLALESIDIGRNDRLSSETLRALLHRVNLLINAASSVPVNLDVLIPARHGSFEVLLDVYPSHHKELLEQGSVIFGLKTLDSLFKKSNDYDKIDRLVSDYRDSPGLIKEYYNLLNFLNKDNLRFSYNWVEYTGRSDHGSMNLWQSKNLIASFNRLVERDSSISEEVDVTGRLVRCNIQKGTWGLISTGGGVVTGFTQVKKGSKSKLEGLVIGNEYSFRCERKASKNTVLSGQKPNLYLIDYTQK